MVRQRIADYLESKGIKQTFICEKTGMTPQALGAALKRERKIDIDEYIAICDALDLPYDYFIKKAMNTQAS